ncbi:HlyD family secretion protein [Caenimonas aquaedulcis]|uniref:HlyD family efflux transporter periplasmic adaptor subunit n=1 Tax=Caenimonas aquaedulcis TaxID=2793270 RepID=A0A931MH88_9BURK|nr:HlyD family efflux transporter periplasmic adaptor subunit [Caenimonas aquaedulcis]MBG9388638.1 HlyD family efflux transporter periplasmic adaptor subunit [Caenimonas aquaedulcis]
MRRLPFPLHRLCGCAAALACMLPAGCGDPRDAGWSGYADADYIYVSSPLPGTLSVLAVEAGQQVGRGKPLFALESESEKAAREEANARLEAAQSQASDADKGKREPEVAVNRAQLAQARAAAELAQHDLTRKRELVARGFISRAQLDEAQATLAQAQARVAELASAVQVARLPARSDARDAADAQVEAARQVLRQSEWRQQQKQQTAPSDAQVADTFSRPGEFVAAGQPVVALLPPANIKARFYVPESELPKLALGQDVLVECDGCGAALRARITRIATRPEYTPPVIYSNSQRRKLVFMLEAKPAPADAPRLRPGQPLSVKAAANATGR